MKLSFILMIFFGLISCSSSKNISKQRKCSKLYKNDFIRIDSEKYKTTKGSDTIVFNELRYVCVASALFTHKVMYDKFGKWDKTIFTSNERGVILYWENIDLWSDGGKFNIFTSGVEGWPIYASVMVFDEKGNDLLKENSNKKIAFRNYFAELLRNNNNLNESFFDEFWPHRDF